MRPPDWAMPSVLAIALLIGPLPGGAQTPPTPSAIKQGFDAAWARQPEQRAASLRREAAEATVAAARRWTPEPPSLEVSTRTDRIVRDDGQREHDAAIAVPLWLPGERSRAQAAASAESQAVEARWGSMQWRLAADVREAHWTHQRALVEHELAARRLANAQQVAADVARRVKAGDLARSDEHQAESAVATAQGALAEAAAGLTQAAHAWTSLTGTSPGGGAGEPRPSDESSASHPALRELQAKGEVARRHSELAVVRTRANPELTVGTTRERGAVGERYGQTVLVGVRIPLGASSTSAAQRASAEADLLEAEGQLARETDRVRLQVESAKARIGSLEVARDAAERRASLARESRGFFEKSFRLGESDLPTRLRIEQEAFEAERQAARSRLEVDAAISQLLQALGRLPE